MTMKLTMKQPYSRTGLFSVKVRGYLDLIRPFTLAAPIFVSIFIMFSGLVYNYSFEDYPNWWGTILQARLTVAMVNAASNTLNQATDAESDKMSKPYRPIPQGVVTADEAQSIAYILYLFSLLFALSINAWFGVFVFLIMIFTVMYSLPPRMKRFLFLNQVWIAIPRGLLGILASWSVFGDPFQKEPIAIGLIAMVFFIGGMTTKDVVDADADKKTGVSTLVNTFGRRNAAFISLPFLIVPFAAIPILIRYTILSSYLLPLTLLFIPSFLIFVLMIKAIESKTLENVHAWALMYLVYIFYAMSFSTLIIFGEIGYLSF